jgi:hypothetical protein
MRINFSVLLYWGDRTTTIYLRVEMGAIDSYVLRESVAACWTRAFSSIVRTICMVGLLWDDGSHFGKLFRGFGVVA